MSSSQNVNLNDQLLRADQVISGLETYAEMIRSRQEFVLSDEHISSLIENIFNNNSELFDRVVQKIIAKIGQGTILRNLAREMNPEVKAQVEGYINQRLTDENLLPVLNKLIALHSNGEPIVFEPEKPELLTLEDCKPLTSMEMVTRAMQELAGEKAIY